MDYEDMDRKIKKNRIHVAVFCNPHNPTGRVWEREELRKALEVYRKNDCIVICDEIWSDIILNENQHIPYAKCLLHLFLANSKQFYILHL